MMARTYSNKQRNLANSMEKGRVLGGNIPPERQNLAAGVHWVDNGSSTVKGLVMGGRSLGNRED